MNSREIVFHHLSNLLTGKRVAILGCAREGLSTYKLLHSLFPELALVLLDKSEALSDEFEQEIQNDSNVKTYVGSQYLDGLVGCDVIFKSPGIPALTLAIQDAVDRGAYLTSQTDIFFAVFGEQTIAITGTKGKSTASSVLTHVLRTLGKDVVFTGNIGSPAFDVIDSVTPQTTIVYETSSHQCEGLRSAPHIAVFLNLFVDHLDYYPSFEAYARAKRQLFLLQKEGDVCVYNAGDERVVSHLIDCHAKRIGFSLHETQFSSLFIEGESIHAFGENVMKASEVPLLGQHNILNILPTIAIASYLHLDMNQVIEALRTVQPVSKRLETIGSVNGVPFIDDALATIPEATIAALAALSDSVETLIVGGFDRQQDFSELARVIAASPIRTLILFPTTGEKIAKLVHEYREDIAVYPARDMEDAVAHASRVTSKGKSVLLSTASASFGMFANYEDRSAQYKACVERMGA